MAEANVGLVFMAANRLAPQYQREAGDLVAFGYMGLLRACELYREDSGFTLSTFAMYRIRGAILDGIRSEKPWSKRLEADRRKLLSALDSALSENRQPTVDELCQQLGWPVDRVLRAKSLCEPAPMGDDMVTMCDAHIAESYV